MKYICFLFVFSLACPIVQAQDKKTIDSLRKAFTNAKHDTLKVQILLELRNNYINDYPDSTIAIGNKMYAIAEKSSYEAGKIDALTSLGIGYYTKGDKVKSIDYAKKALALAEKANLKRKIANCYSALGNFYNLDGNLLVALEYYQKALKEHERQNNPHNIAIALHNIGEIFNRQSEYAKALTYHQKALSLRKKIQDTQGIIASLISMAFSYDKQGKYNLAISHYKHSLNFENSLSATRKATIQANMGFAYMRQTKYDSAAIYFQEARKIQEELKRESDLAYTFDGLAKLSMRQKKIAQAVQYAQQGMELAKKAQNIFAIKEFAETLALTYKSNQQYDKALEYYEQFKQLQDSIFTVDKAKAIANLETKMELNALSKEAEQQRQTNDLQRTVIYVVSGGLLMAMLLAYLAYRSRQAEKRAKNEINTQKEEITAQAEQLDIANKTKDQLFSIIAHDLRSPMMSFQGINKQIRFFLSKNRPEKLEELGENIEKASTRLNALLDNLLQWAMLQKQVIKVSPQDIDLQEATTHCLSYYEGLAQSQQVTLHQQVGKEFITTDYNILQTILRNLISNALKFTPEGGHIYLTYQHEGRQGTLSVRDTGAGMSAEKVATLFQGVQFKSEQGLRGEKGTGIGLQLCYELAQQINATLSVQSKEGEGTTFSLVLDDIQARQ